MATKYIVPYAVGVLLILGCGAQPQQTAVRPPTATTLLGPASPPATRLSEFGAAVEREGDDRLDQAVVTLGDMRFEPPDSAPKVDKLTALNTFLAVVPPSTMDRTRIHEKLATWIDDSPLKQKPDGTLRTARRVLVWLIVEPSRPARAMSGRPFIPGLSEQDLAAIAAAEANQRIDTFGMVNATTGIIEGGLYESGV